MVLKRGMSKFVFNIFIAENKSMHIAKYSFKNMVRPRNLPIIFKKFHLKKIINWYQEWVLKALFFDIAYW